MDTGKGTFQQVTANQEDLLKAMDELERKYSEHGGWFKEGESLKYEAANFVFSL